ncbi:hypothetical protein HXX76_011274 [Chlamydomonas incerta]|uniref:Uncharacterized protein n=1 Tax=Chlamydomonas incerta TaxID=51695 RepID=A0A835SPR7_CHLIN|nr:hypothetical protein HXX76_011274 [Chlamydomonas incerta]|eukprot:KAG2429032.1 hypothetical protein HXX76_011274 [Chlamydomonas incerta]
MGGSAEEGPTARSLERASARFPPVQQSVSDALAAAFLQARVMPSLQRSADALQLAAKAIAKVAKTDARLRWRARRAKFDYILALMGILLVRGHVHHNVAALLHDLAASNHRLSAASHEVAAASLRVAAAGLRVGTTAAGPLHGRAAAANAAAVACDAGADQSDAAAAEQAAAGVRRVALAEECMQAKEAAERSEATAAYIIPRVVAHAFLQYLWSYVVLPWLAARIWELTPWRPQWSLAGAGGGGGGGGNASAAAAVAHNATVALLQ